MVPTAADNDKAPSFKSSGDLEAIQLNGSWRVSLSDPIQWVLQRDCGRGGWVGRSFCRKRSTLLRCIRDYCGAVDPETMAIIEALPEWREASIAHAAAQRR